MKKLIVSLFILTAMTTVTTIKAQEKIVISERTAAKIESIRAKTAKDAADADKKMEQEIEKAKKQIDPDTKKAADDAKKRMETDSKKGAEDAQKKADKAIAKAKEKAEKTKLKAKMKAEKEIQKIKTEKAINI